MGGLVCGMVAVFTHHKNRVSSPRVSNVVNESEGLSATSITLAPQAPSQQGEENDDYELIEENDYEIIADIDYGANKAESSTDQFEDFDSEKDYVI